MTLAKALQVAAGNSQETGDVAEAIDFDGTNDYLSRASDLTGNTDGNNFTLSFFVYPTTSNLLSVIYAIGTYTGIRVNVTGGSTTTSMQVVCRNSAGTLLLNFTVSDKIPLNTFTHILVSCDLSNAANRYVYINDISTSVTWSTYTNGNIDFTGTSWSVGATNLAGDLIAGRLNNVFLDYTYRDLSITANRRLFVTADLKPAAGQAALNPILYLPMNDPTAPGFNAGTGGNFTLTGTVARSGRGPNQYNAPYSDLDGTADYLSRTSLSGIADGKQLTVNFCANIDTFTTGFVLVFSTTSYFRVYFASNAITINALNAAGSTILSASYTIGSAVNRNYSIQISCDLSDTNKRHMIVNGQAVAATWSTYTNDNIDFTHTTYQVGRYSTNQYFNGRLGALWFNTSYIDLSSAANLAKFVTGTGIDAKPVDLGATGELPTGTAPIIYLPMYGNNAGKNYGTGGDFTVNSGPYTGARGPNEFWGNKMRTTVSSYVGRTSAMTGVTSGKKFSCSFFVSQGQAAGGRVLSLVGNTGDNTEYLMIDIDVDGNFSIYGYNSSQVNILALPNMPFGGTATLANVYHVLIAVDLSTASYRIYVNGVSKSPSGGIVLTNDNIKFDGGRPSVGAGPVASGNAGDKSEFYFTTEYIDFTLEANRLKFRDAFGNPVNLTQQIEDAAIPNPAIYMRFPPTSFGTNSGTGGDFTVNGTITDGGQL